ncbi:MAG: tetratricopeptide repeat protein [Rhodospirillales bacterium]
MTELATTALVQAGLAHHQAGRLDEAEAAYRRALALAPGHPDALHLSGVIAYQRGRLGEAIELYRRAVAVNPAYPAALNNLATALKDAGELAPAREAAERALALAPSFAEGHNTLGNVLLIAGDAAGAAAAFRRAATANPRLAAAHGNLGNALAALGDRDGAVAAYRAALAIDPAHADAHFNLGNAARAAGRADEAAAAYRAAVRSRPDYADAWNNLGLVLLAAGDAAGALAAFDAALAARPGFAAAHNNRGTALREAHRSDAAIAAFNRALEFAPGDAAARYNLGNTLRDRGDVAGAIEALRRVVDADPGHDDALALLVETLQGVCDWPALAVLEPRLRAATHAALAAGRRPAEMALTSLRLDDDPARHRAVAAAWARAVAAEVATCRMAAAPRPAPRDRLRVGYLAHDFRDHPITHLVLGVLAGHDRARVEVSAYAYGPPDDGPHRRAVAAAVDRFADVAALTHAQAARRIRDDGIDILVDLTGPTLGGRLQIAALRPAPVQAWWLGYPGTTGADFIDYVIGDPVATPPGTEADFAEALVLLPDTFQSTQRPPPAAPPPRAALGLPDAAVVLASFNQAAKIEPAVFDAWLDVLAAVPDAVLWLYAGHPLAEASLRRAAATRGLDGRLVFAPRTPLAAHLARLAAADLVLDTRRYNGGTTTSQALGAGVPVVAVAGRGFAARMSASLLAAAGLPDLAVPDLDAYRALAAALASDRPRLAALRARLAANLGTAPLFDTPRLVAGLEAAYRAMWARAAAGLPPAMIAVGNGLPGGASAT